METLEVLVIGAGTSGKDIAHKLARNQCSVTLADAQYAALAQMKHKQQDLKTLQGDASDPAFLKSLGIADIDIVIVLTNSDQMNLMICKLCSMLSDKLTTIARITNQAYMHDHLLHGDGFHIDHPINPDQVVADRITHVILHPGCLSIDHFFGGAIAIAHIRATTASPQVGHTIEKFHDIYREFYFHIVAINREGKFLKDVSKDTYIFSDDEVYVIIQPDNLSSTIEMFGGKQQKNTNIIIAGGSHVARRVAKQLEGDHFIKIVEPDIARCEKLANELENSTIFRTEVTDEFLLKSEGIENSDIFCALSRSDLENMLSVMLAKRLGAQKTMTLVHHDPYVDILEQELGIIVSPSEILVGEVLQEVRKQAGSPISAVHSLRHGIAEAMEATIKKDEKKSNLVGKSVGEIEWPDGMVLGAIMRGGKPIAFDDETVFQHDDRVLFFVYDNSSNASQKIEKILTGGVLPW